MGIVPGEFKAGDSVRDLFASICAVVLAGGLVTGCASEGNTTKAEVEAAVANALASQAAAASAEPVAPITKAPAAPAAPVEAAAAEPASAVVDFAMPNVVGMNLQDAQNKIQTLGVYYSTSHDKLGSRNQIVDSNWKVCDQTPAAGTRIRGPASDFEGKFDFGSVKLTEACP